MVKIKVRNEKLKRYLKYKLNKSENEFEEDELAKIDELVLDPIKLNGVYENIDVNIIKYFINLKNLEIRNMNIENKIIKELLKIKTLEKISFERCTFEKCEDLINLNIKEIGVINCNIEDYNFIYKLNELESVSIIKGNVSIKQINKLKKLKYLKLSNSKIFDFEELNLPELKKLYIDGINIEETEIISKLKNIDSITISEKQYNKNKAFYENMQKNAIKNLIVEWEK